MKVLLPVDGSEYTKRMLGYMAAHEELLGPGHEYTAFTAVPSIPAHATRFLDRATVDDYYKDLAEQVLKPIEAFAAQQGWKLKVVYVHGAPAEAIAAFANENKPDLIVMGAHGHSALGSAILGSVASGVLARCATPVLLVR